MRRVIFNSSTVVIVVSSIEKVGPMEGDIHHKDTKTQKHSLCLRALVVGSLSSLISERV